MSTVQSTDTMTDADMEENAPAQEHGRATKAPAGPRRLTGLALAAALLLALGFATGRATDRLWPAGRAGGAPAAAGQTLAADGYAPNALDYREDHRVAAPAYGTDPMNYREDHRLDSPAGAAAPISIERQRFLELNTQFPTAGAATPVSVERQRFLERNTQFPTGGAPTFVPGPSVSPKGPR